MTESLGPEDTQGEGMGGPDIGSRRVIYVPPSLAVIEQLARVICQRLAATNPMLDFEKITREFSAFLSVLARMHANRLNRRRDSPFS